MFQPARLFRNSLVAVRGRPKISGKAEQSQTDVKTPLLTEISISPHGRDAREQNMLAPFLTLFEPRPKDHQAFVQIPSAPTKLKRGEDGYSTA